LPAPVGAHGLLGASTTRLDLIWPFQFLKLIHRIESPNHPWRNESR
jgi:hypothetical protein